MWVQQSRPSLISDEEPGYLGRGYTETLAALNEIGATVYGLQSGGFSVLDDVDEIVSDTGGETFVMGRDSSEIVSSVESALGSADDNISVELQPFGDFSGLVQSITPVFDGANPGDAFTSFSPGDTVDFEVTFDRGSFASGTRQTFSFRFKVVAEGVATIQEVPVTVILR